MAKNSLPKTLFVKVEKESSGEEYFVPNTDADMLVDMGETITIGEYRLVETRRATGVTQFSSPKKSR